MIKCTRGFYRVKVNMVYSRHVLYLESFSFFWGGGVGCGALNFYNVLIDSAPKCKAFDVRVREEYG
jgi:hypothetical protein